VQRSAGLHRTGGQRPDGRGLDAFWALPAEVLLQRLGSRADGLAPRAAARRLASLGPNLQTAPQRDQVWRLLWRQLSNPLVAMLLAGAAISMVVAEWWDAAVLLVVVLSSTALAFGKELRASTAMARLRGRLALVCSVRRGGVLQALPASRLVPGDVIALSAGKLVPADGVVLAANGLQVVEAALTGEPFPVEKRPGAVTAATPLRARGNCVWQGSSVRSGTATVLVVHTGARTAMGAVAQRLQSAPPESDFARGVRQFGDMLLRVMLLLMVAVLVTNHALGRPAIDSMLFAMALAVGMAPELLPAIVSVSLAGGARRLAALGVLVRRLDAIEDLGGMDVLCTDKTGTLTVGVMDLEAAVDPAGTGPDRAVLQLAHLNAAFETGIDNPIDAAVVRAAAVAGLDTQGWRKVTEVPYDFVHKRISITVADSRAPGWHRLIVKGAVAQVLAECTRVQLGGGEVPLDAGWRSRLEAYVRAQGQAGRRVLAVAVQDRPAPPDDADAAAGATTAATPAASTAATTATSTALAAAADEPGLALAGFLLFCDPVKPDAAAMLARLAACGVRSKLLTGDSRHVAAHVAAALGLDAGALLTGADIGAASDEVLWHLAPRTDLFVELEPAHKERIVRALQHAGHAVGFLGDGINDAPALHAADVGISVDQAVDVARESADLVLLQPDLQTLLTGIEEGRRTFANTMKYITITTSANFGNMLSMALATPWLPFLPMTATQVLLNNLLSDLPSMAIATDRVDASSLARAQRWSPQQVRRDMLVFGLASSAFDLIAFALLLRLLHAGEGLFQSAWFVLSLLTELVVVLVLRTRGAAWASRPGGWLLGATLSMCLVGVLLPLAEPLAVPLALVPLTPPVLGTAAALVLAYALVTEALKRWLYRPPPSD
jgi:Mg2+-importing ATPase